MMQVEFEAHMLILAACCDYFREVLLPTGIGTPGEHHGGNPPETNAAASTAPGGAAGKRRVLVDVGGVKVTALLSDRASSSPALTPRGAGRACRPVRWSCG